MWIVFERSDDGLEWIKDADEYSGNISASIGQMWVCFSLTSNCLQLLSPTRLRV